MSTNLKCTACGYIMTECVCAKGKPKLKTWTEEYLNMIDEALYFDDKLTDWERKFLRSIEADLHEGFKPTYKQINVLENIHDKVTLHD